MQNSKLEQTFHIKNILKFTFPTILMMVFLSMYTTIDGIMVARLVSDEALAAVNIVYPVVSLILAVALMLSSGANAVIAFNLGENKLKEANQKLTSTYCIGGLIGFLLMVVGIVFLEPILKVLGTSQSLMPYAVPYLKVMLYFAPMMIFQILTQTFLVTDGKPLLGLGLSLASGIANVALDYYFMAVLNLGVAGAALATGLGYVLTGGVGILLFLNVKKKGIRFSKPKFESHFIRKTLSNGSSEMVNNLSIAFTTFLFNVTMMRLIGNQGVVAITIILYVQFIQMAIYFGYAQGISPIISFKYGAGKIEELKQVIKHSFAIITAFSILVIMLSLGFSSPVIRLFTGDKQALFDLTREGFMIYLTAFVFIGINVFMSAMFTALGNGRVSAMLSFLRTFVFIVGSLLLFPSIWGVTGVFVATPISEGLAFCLSIFAYYRGKSQYGY